MIWSDIWHKHHEWYFEIVWNLRQFWNITSGIYAKYHVQIMLLFAYTTTHEKFVLFTCRYFKLSWNTTALSQSNCRNFSCSSISVVIQESLGFGISRHFPDSGIQITWQGATRTTCTASQTEPHEVKAQCLPLLYGRSFRFPTQTEQVESTDTEYHPGNAFLVQCSNPTLKWCLRSIKKQDLFTFLKPCIMKWF